MEYGDRRILIGTIGYHNLGNHSIGPTLAGRIASAPWADQIDVREMNWGPIAIVQEFESMPQPYERVVLLCAIERPGRAIGTPSVLEWQGGKLDDTAVQDCIGDAVTGVISVQNLLVIGEHFGIWPDQVYLVDVEPGPEQAGMALTPEVAGRIDEYLALLQRVALLGPNADVNPVGLTAQALFQEDQIQ